MVGTRAGDTKKRSTRRGNTSGASDDAAPANGSANGAIANPGTVALVVTGNWAAPPSIGQLEAALADAERELTEAHEKRLSARRQKESVARLYLGRRSEAKTTKPPPWAAQRRP